MTNKTSKTSDKNFVIKNKLALKSATKSISSLDLKKDHYVRVDEQTNLTINNKSSDPKSCNVYLKKNTTKTDNPKLYANVDIVFGKHAKNCSILFDPRGTIGKFKINVKRHNSIIVISKKTIVVNGDLDIRSSQDNDLIALGEKLLINSGCSFISGGLGIRQNPGPYIVIGDRSIISLNVTLRNTDSHPIYDEKGKPVNYPNKGIHIDKNVWLGQNVTVLKNANYIADGVIVAINSTVTKSVPNPNVVVAGTPAKMVNDGKKFYWKLRNYDGKYTK